jgi:hypothetical protein
MEVSVLEEFAGQLDHIFLAKYEACHSVKKLSVMIGSHISLSSKSL